MHRELYLIAVFLVIYCDALSPLSAVLNRRNTTEPNSRCAWGLFPYERGNTMLCAECHAADVGWFTPPVTKTQYCLRSEPYSPQQICRAVTSLAPQCPLNSYCDYTSLTCQAVALAPRCDVTPCPAPLLCDTRTSHCVTCLHRALDAHSAHRCVDGAARPVTITWSELSALPRHLLLLMIGALAACCLLALSINFNNFT